MIKKILFISICLSLFYSQDIYTDYIIEEHDTLDVFSYQIPSNYSSIGNHPLLVAFHQWGGNQDSPYYTDFDEQAELRNWVFLSPFGGSSNNYNHQEAQIYVQKAIKYLIDNFSIDKNRIYMVGGSMGGASGAIFANNHLNPEEPMVAATASASGILDCERRYYEMDGNNSMIEWFGGSPEEVPFEYHRNSAVYFADSTQSMHYNLQYTPLYLDFGSTEPHRSHAEDLYSLLLGYNQNMWIDEDPIGSHGYSVIDELHACDWLSQYELLNNPSTVNVNLDEPSRAYWLEAYNQLVSDDFIRLECEKWSESEYHINQFSNSDTLLFHILDNLIPSEIHFYIEPNSIFTIGITGTSPLIPIISDISFDGFGNYYWDNLSLEDGVIYVDNISTGMYTLYLTANDDLNLDGVWDILDITLLIGFIIEESSPTEIELMTGDINQDEILDILDILLIVNMILDN